MDAGHLRTTARSGSDFLRYGTGDVRVKSLGDQDEDVDIDDGDTGGTPPANVSGAGVSGVATGVGTPSKSVAGSTPAPRVGVGNILSSTSSERRREQLTSGSQASIGRRAVPQLVAGEDGSSKYSDASVPKVALEGTSKRSDLRKQMPAKSSGRRVRQLAVMQQQSKRKASETEPFTSAPAKRTKLHNVIGVSSDKTGHDNRADESNVALSMREDSPLKRKVILQDGEREGREKSLPVTVRGKRPRVLRLEDDDSDEELFERIVAHNDGVRNAETSSIVAMPTRAGDSGGGSLRSAFPLNAKRKVHPPVPQTESALATHSFWQWITCTKCKKIRLVNADEDLDVSSWCCEKNTRNPKYASCSAPQEKRAHCKVEERQATIIELDSLEEVQEAPDYPDELERKKKAHRKMAWVKLQVDGKDVWWPGLTVKAVPAAVQKIIDEAADTPRAVRLFHPPRDLEEYQVVRKSSLKPFEVFFLSYRNSSSHPDFKVAVIEADQYFTEPDMEELSEFSTASKSETRLNAAGDIAKCLLEDMPHEHAESNELEVEDAEMPGDDPHCSQVEADDEIEFVEDGEVNQALVENGVAGELLDAGHGDASILKEHDPHCSPSQGDQPENGMPDARLVYCSTVAASEPRNDRASPEAINELNLTDEREDALTSVAIEVEGTTEVHVDVKPSGTVEASFRSKASEGGGTEELCVYSLGEKLVLDLLISPTKRLIEYDDATKELHFQDGTAVRIDAVSLGKEFNKCSTGPSLHECIYEVGKANIRKRFPTRSSTGLKFGSLDQDGDFAKRLRDTWLREYDGEPMPEYLTSRFVAGCILEERGKFVNWAYELTRSVRNELKKIGMKTLESFSPSVLKLIGHLLEKKVDPAPISAVPQPNSEAVEDEEPIDFSGFETRCHQCKHGGELLCCDGPGCPKTFHLACLNPPLKEVPTTAFICPVCLAKNIALPDAEVVTSSAPMIGNELPTDHGSREELQGVAESSTIVGDIDALDPPVKEDSVPNLEVSKVTIGAVGELGDPHVRTSAVGGEVDLLEDTRTMDVAHLQSNTTAHGSEHVACSEHVDPENVNGVGDRCVSSTCPDTTAGEESQISGSPSLDDSFQVEKCVHSRNPAESDLEEGEFLPSEQVNVVGNTAALDISASKLPSSSTPPLTQEVLARVEPPYEEDEFPSSDDHNNFCEGCEVGGELMYVTTPSFASTPSSSLLLCDGKGCRVVYHKECLNPPLETIPAGEWYCPKCEKRKVEKIWAVRNVDETSKLRRCASTRTSDASSLESYSEDEVRELIPLATRFKSSSQRSDREAAGLASGRRAGLAIRSLKDDGLEYLVQWKARSHAHDKWVSEKELEKIAPKELARFKKLQPGQVKYDPEWAEPERVLQKRFTRVTRRQPDASSGIENIHNHQKAEIEWFVKWKGLGYDRCTWEPAGVLATSRGIEVINAYERWEDAAKQRASPESREEAERLAKSPFKGLIGQPEWMIRPEQEQLDALNKLLKLWHSRLNGILIYEASQEKIALTIMFFLSLVENYRVVHPILVVVPKSLIQNWNHELSQWASKLYIVHYASKLEDARDIIRRAEFNSFCEPFRSQIVLTSFDVITCDMNHLKKVEWEVLIVDEGRTQRVQKSCQKFYRMFSQIRSIFRLLLLSEPLKSNVEELCQFVNFLEPRKSVFPHGDESIQVAELRRRLAGRVLEYIPKNRLTEYWVPVEMTPTHLDQYYHILVNHYPTLSRNHRDHQIQEVVTKLRQSCNHPFLADPSFEGRTGQGLTPKELLDHHIDISGKMRLLHLMMPILKSAGLRVLIFSQETRQLDILERYMTQSHGSDSYERLDTDIAVNVKEAAILRFNAEGSKRFVLLLKTGIHVSFRNVQFVLIYDSDWNPENDMRALHKIHNEGEARSKALPVLRFYTHLTVEESTLALSRDEKLPSTRAGFSAKICQKLLTWGASKIFDHFDNKQYPAGSSLYRPKGAKICPKAKLKQVVYSLDSISTLFRVLLSQEESSKIKGDELLEAILVPRDEPAPLFSESDHPITMITGESARTFWDSSLKWRHDDWQAKKVSNLGKGHRGKKRITYDEDAMASAVFEKAHSEENDKRRPKRRKVSGEEDQEGVTGPSNLVSFQQRLPPLSTGLPSEGDLPTSSTGDDLPSVIYLPGGPTQVEIVSPPDSSLPESPMETALPSVIYLPGSSTQVETVSPLDSILPVMSTHVETALPSGSNLPEPSTQVETASPLDSNMPETCTYVETALPSDNFAFCLAEAPTAALPSDSNLAEAPTEGDTALPSDSNLAEAPTEGDTALPSDSNLAEAPTEGDTALPSDSNLAVAPTEVHTALPSDRNLALAPTEVDTALPSDRNLAEAPTEVGTALPSDSNLAEAPTEVGTALPSDSNLAEAPTEVDTTLPSDSNLAEAPTEVDTALPSDRNLALAPTEVDTALPSDMNLAEAPTEVGTALPSDSNLAEAPTEVGTALPSDSNLAEAPTEVDTTLPSDSNLAEAPTEVDTALPSDRNLALAPTEVDTALPSDMNLAEAPTEVGTALPSDSNLAEAPTEVGTALPSDSNLAEAPTEVDTTLPSDSNLAEAPTEVDTALPSDSNLAEAPTEVDTALPSDSNLPEPSTQVETVSPLDSNMSETSTHVETALPSDSNLAEAPTKVDTALPSNRGQLEGVTDSSQQQLSEVPWSASDSLNYLESTQSGGSQQAVPPGHIRVREFMTYLQAICSHLDLPEAMCIRVQELFRYFVHVSKKLHRPLQLHEISALQLCSVWFAAEEMGHDIDKLSSLHMVEENYREVVHFGTEEHRVFIVTQLYGKVASRLKSYKPGVWSAPSAGVPTTSQPPSVPESISDTPHQPSRAETEVSPQNVHPEAINTEEPEGTGPQVEAEVPLPVSETVQEGSAPAREEAEPVVAEADAEVVFVEADHRLVPEDSFNEFLTPNPVSVLEPLPVPVSSFRRVSGGSEVAQGLGWVIVDSPPNIPVEEPPFAEQLTEETGSEPATVDSLPSSQVGAGPATPVDASPVTRPAEVTPTEPTRPASRTPAPEERANLTRRLHEDKTYVIEVQKQESSLLNTQFERRFEARKRQYDDHRRRLHYQDAGMLEVLEVEYKKDMATIQRHKDQDTKLLNARQRADRDKLNEVYFKLLSMVSGQLSGLDVPSLEMEVQKIKDYYKEFMRKSIDPRLTQGSRPSTSASAQVSAENQQRQHSGRVVSAATPVASPQQGHTVQVPPQNQRSSASTQSGSVPTAHTQPSIVHALPSTRSQRPPVISTAQIQPSVVQPVTGHSQRPSMMSTAPAQSTIVQPVTRLHSQNIQRPAAPAQASIMHSVLGQGLPHSQRPPVLSTAPSSMPPVVGLPSPQGQRAAAPMQPVTGLPLPHSPRPGSIQTRGQAQTQTAIPTPPPNVQRGAAAVSRSYPPAGFGTVPGHQGPDVFVKEKEKLSKQLEKAKVTYDSESQAIKAGYDKEAEILHKKYEGLLVERHREYTKEQSQTQQALQKVEYNRQLAEALRFREELAARAAIFAGIQASQAAAQAPQGRPRTSAATVPPNLSRCTTNTTVSGATMQINSGSPSTPVSVPPRFGIPAAPPGEPSRSSMMEAYSVLAANRNAVNPGINAGETNSQPHGVSAPMSQAQFEDPILAIIRGSAAPLEPDNPSPPLETTDPNLPSAGIMEAQIHVEGAPPVQLPSHINTATVVPALEQPVPNFINLSDSDDE